MNFNQVIFILFLFLSGFLIGRFSGLKNYIHQALYSFPIGLFNYFFIIYLCDLFNFPFYLWILLGFTIIIITICLLINQQKPVFERIVFGKLLITLIIISLISFLFWHLRFINTSTDTFNYYIPTGKFLGITGYQSHYLNKIGSSLSVGLIPSIIHSSGILFNFKLLYIIFPFISINIILLLFEHFFKRIRLIHFYILILILFITTRTYLVHSFFIHSNLLCALFILISVLSIHNYIESDSDNPIFLLFTGFIGICFSRLEGTIYLCVLLIAYLPHLNESQLKKVGIVHALVALLVSTFYIKAFLISDRSDSSFFNLFNLASILLPLNLLLILYIPNKWVSLLRKKLDLVSLVFFVFCLICWGIVQPSVSFRLGYTTAMNFFVTGGWGNVWIILLPVLLFILIYRSKEYSRPLLLFLAIYFTATLLIGMAGNNFRASENGSGNRMLIHIFPVVVLFLVDSLGRITDSGDKFTFSKSFIIFLSVLFGIMIVLIFTFPPIVTGNYQPLIFTKDLKSMIIDSALKVMLMGGIFISLFYFYKTDMRNTIPAILFTYLVFNSGSAINYIKTKISESSQVSPASELSEKDLIHLANYQYIETRKAKFKSEIFPDSTLMKWSPISLGIIADIIGNQNTALHYPCDEKIAVLFRKRPWQYPTVTFISDSTYQSLITSQKFEYIKNKYKYSIYRDVFFHYWKFDNNNTNPTWYLFFSGNNLLLVPEKIALQIQS